MRIFAIESSCDETSAAIILDGRQVLSNVVTSSEKLFAETGGVIPEEAARKQLEVMIPVIHACLHESKLQSSDIDAIAVTRGPGLLTSLLVGTTTARALAALWKKPLIGVHHTLGHLASPWLTAEKPIDEIQFPILTLSASGGHTDLWYRTSHTKGKLISRTRDDAAGEAFDKGASMLGLPYPGGPSFAKAATTGDAKAFAFSNPLAGTDTLDFSFSGLKTALKYTIRDTANWQDRIPDLAASFEQAICRHLVDRIEQALETYDETREVHLVGGVSANTSLRAMVQKRIQLPMRVSTSLRYCTDNAAMIGSAAYFLQQEMGDAAYAPFTTQASLPLESVVQA